MEFLFELMYKYPVEGFVQIVKHLPNINAKNVGERTLLHQAVMLGKPDWVQEILEAGADPLIVDRYGHSALKIAKTMISNHPGDKEREDIFKLLQSRHNICRPTNVDLINDVKTFFSTELAASKSSIEKHISGISGDLTKELDTVKESLNEVKKQQDSTVTKDNLQSLLSTELASIKGSIETNISGIRSYLTTELDRVKQSLEDVKKQQDIHVTKVDTLHQVCDGANNEQAKLVSMVTTQKEILDKICREQDNAFSIVDSLKQSVADLGNGINGVDSMVTTQRESLDEVKKELGNTVSKVDTLQSQLTTEHSSIKESMETHMKELVATLENCKNIGWQIPDEVPTPTPTRPPTPEYKPNREACVEAMMRKTELKPSNEGNISKMKNHYGMLYDKDHITSCILEFLRFQSSVTVLFDFESSHIVRMKPTLRDHDGRERSGSDFWSFTDFEERKAYVSGDWSDAIAILAEALSQLSVYLAFNNRGLPYSGEGDGERLKRILEEAEKKKRDGVGLDYRIKNIALDKQNQQGKEIYLTPAVPYMIAYHGSSSGRSMLSAQLPSLLEYYDQHVVATLSRETKKAFESAMG